MKSSQDRSVCSSSTGSAETIQQIATWLSQCIESHSCGPHKPVRDSLFLPTRLIHVESAPGSESIRLVSSKDLPRRTSYATLSHSWGTAESGPRVTLTKDNLSDFQEKGPSQALPRTFADAFQVVRELGIEYLWVDSLCIIQDSKKDWFNEAAQMWEIYMNSQLNISATASAASSQGLFRERIAHTAASCLAEVCPTNPQFLAGEYICYIEDEWDRLVDHGPVNS